MGGNAAEEKAMTKLSTTAIVLLLFSVIGVQTVTPVAQVSRMRSPQPRRLQKSPYRLTVQKRFGPTFLLPAFVMLKRSKSEW